MTQQAPTRAGTVIIGSGFSGLAVAIALKKRGIDDFVILERGDAIGGTWRDNTYPGCCCDVPSHLYSFSFAPSSEWTHAYAPHHEIRAYIERVAAQFDLHRHVVLNTEVARCTWDEAASEWRVGVRDGREVRAPALVSATGFLSNPAAPKLPGVGTFAGPAFHSAKWRHDVDLAGKKVGVIGTGASAIQFVPHLQKAAREVVLFQRTPPWILPRRDREFGPLARALLKLAPLRWLYRQSIYVRQESSGVAFVNRPRLMRYVKGVALQHIKRQIADPALRKLVTPTYTPGCKRVLVSDDYYPAVAQPNVRIVTSSIASITATGVALADAAHEDVDVLVYGTGFAVHEFFGPMKVHGKGGVELGEQWQPGAEAYLGLTVHGFPNFFVMVGPNTGLGHTSMLLMIEAQAAYVARGIELMRTRKLAELEVKLDVQRRFNAWLGGHGANTVWKSGCKSWYLNDAGKNDTLWPGFTFGYRARTAQFRTADYELRAARAARPTEAGAARVAA